jgi:hypothetical protein
MLVVWAAEGSAARLVAELPVANVTGVRGPMKRECGRPALRGVAATTGRSRGKLGDDVVLDLVGYVLL